MRKSLFLLLLFFVLSACTERVSEQEIVNPDFIDAYLENETMTTHETELNYSVYSDQVDELNIGGSSQIDLYNDNYWEVYWGETDPTDSSIITTISSTPRNEPNFQIDLIEHEIELEPGEYRIRKAVWLDEQTDPVYIVIPFEVIDE